MRIAVVDDEKMYRELIFDIVKNESENIDIYESGERFLEADKEYELIFMDIEMGGLDGIEVSTIYHKDYPDAIICLVTTHTEMVQNGYKARAFRFIYKELKIGLIISIIGFIFFLGSIGYETYKSKKKSEMK